MENRKVEKALDNISDGSFGINDINCIGMYILKLEKENNELQAKDKALDKALDIASHLLSMEVKKISWKHPSGVFMNSDYWKEWCLSNE